MLRTKLTVALSLVAIVALGFISLAVAQEATSQPRMGRGQMPTPEEMRKNMLDRMKTDLGATDDEWTALAPKIEKVMTAQRDARGGGNMFGMGGPRQGGRNGRTGRGGPAAGGDQPAPTPANAPAQTEVQKKMADLQKLVQEKDSKPEDVKAALAAYRDARNKAKTDLEKAQKDLQEVVTVKQEAFLVTRGMLD